MKKAIIILASMLLVVWVGQIIGATFSDVDDEKYQGKTGLKALTVTLDANFAKLETTDGASPISTVTATDKGAGQHVTTLTLSSVPLKVTYGGPGTNSAGGVKIYDLPEGYISIDAVCPNIHSATNVDLKLSDKVCYAMGTAVGAGSGFTTTECDLTATNVFIASTNWYRTVRMTNVVFNGTATAKDIYLNMGVTTNGLSATRTNFISGSIQILWRKLGDL